MLKQKRRKMLKVNLIIFGKIFRINSYSKAEEELVIYLRFTRWDNRC